MRRRGYPTGPFGYRQYGYRPYGRSYGGYGGRGGGSCLRDVFLLESGCCLAEALGDSCLLGLVLAGQWLATLTKPGRHRSPGSPGRTAGEPPLVAAIRVYQQQISRRRRPCCRFTPSCSEYAAQALLRHGTVRGGGLAVRRLCRCRPFGRRGPDPVPAR